VDEARQKETAGDSHKLGAEGNGFAGGEAAAPAVPAMGPARRRKDCRYDIDDSAAIHLLRVAATLHGRILDLSVSGCRIRTDDRLLLGIYTRVEIEFRAAGVPFRLAGVIQAIHDQNTVGIRFLDVSQRKRQQVEELIQEIVEMREAKSRDAAQTNSI
jgi:c-di-GMP-binding flagellar brake protein YcgR